MRYPVVMALKSSLAYSIIPATACRTSLFCSSSGPKLSCGYSRRFTTDPINSMNAQFHCAKPRLDVNKKIKGQCGDLIFRLRKVVQLVPFLCTNKKVRIQPKRVCWCVEHLLWNNEAVFRLLLNRSLHRTKQCHGLKPFAVFLFFFESLKMHYFMK